MDDILMVYLTYIFSCRKATSYKATRYGYDGGETAKILCRSFAERFRDQFDYSIFHTDVAREVAAIQMRWCKYILCWKNPPDALKPKNDGLEGE